jgi:hypothetical protein
MKGILCVAGLLISASVSAGHVSLGCEQGSPKICTSFATGFDNHPGPFQFTWTTTLPAIIDNDCVFLSNESWCYVGCFGDEKNGQVHVTVHDANNNLLGSASHNTRCRGPW